jgi:outer membrane protein assembly factor BamB
MDRELNRERIQELLALVSLGVATPEERAEVLRALEHDPELRREAQELERVLTGVAATETRTPPAHLKTKLLEQARLESARFERGNTARPSEAPRALEARKNTVPNRVPSASRSGSSRGARRWFAPVIAGGLTIAAAVAGFVAFNRPGMDVGVVASTRDGGLVYTNASDRNAPVRIVNASWQSRPVRFDTSKTPYFTHAISSDGFSYLLDAGNQTLYIIDEQKGELIDRWPVPDGASGLDLNADYVVVKGASSGTVVSFRRNGLGKASMVEARISNPAQMPLADLMDAAEIRGERLYVTHHMTGLVTILELGSNRELRRASVGQKPVSLAFTDDDLLVLDYAGTLFKLDPDTLEVRSSLKLEGTPDRITVAPNNVAYLSDRTGFVTAVNTVQLEVIARRNLGGKPMDVSMMPDGHVAVANGADGLKILDDKLETVRSL